MTPQNIYKNVLLPEILEFCQAFFPSLIEQAHQQCTTHSDFSTSEINAGSEQFLAWLKYTLRSKLIQGKFTASNAQTVKITSAETEEIQQLSYFLTLAAQQTITAPTNPLAPDALLQTISEHLRDACTAPIQPLEESLITQFEAVSLGFYKKINSLFSRYFAAAITQTLTTKPRTNSYDAVNLEDICDTEPSVNNALNSSPCVEQADAVIQHIKSFYEHHYTLDLVGPRLLSLTKKLYLPLINYSLSNPLIFTQIESHHTLNTLLQHLKIIGQNNNAALTTKAEHAIQAFINKALDNAADIKTTINQLALLAEHGKNASLQATTLAQKNIAHQPARQHSPATQKTSVKHSIREQAQHVINTTLQDSDPRNSIAAQYKKEWLQVLIVNGNMHGTASQAWWQCVSVFVSMASFTQATNMPIPLAHKIEAQLKFAGITTGLPLAGHQKSRSANDIHAAYSTYKEGSWFDYQQSGQTKRCKLAAVIRQIGRYIFVSRQGQKILEIDQATLTHYIANGTLKPLKNTSLGNSLEDVLANIRQATETST